jgi:WhiB family redox-sensing transcriptional regulator
MIELPKDLLQNFTNNAEGPPLCAETAPDIFFIDSEEGATPAQIYAGRKLAKQICSGCPYQIRCAEWAIVKGETLGIWGGLTPRERSDIRRTRARGGVVNLGELRVFNPDTGNKPNRNGVGKKRATSGLES